MDYALLSAIVALLALLLTALRKRQKESAIQTLLSTFGGAQAAAQRDARLLLVWQPLAESARTLFPDAFASLDAATGRRFPFDKDAIERAHSTWTADWLAWEKTHDEEYRLKAAMVEQELRNATGDAAALVKARLDRVQHEKIERYQQRYEDYIRTAKALQALLS